MPFQRCPRRADSKPLQVFIPQHSLDTVVLQHLSLQYVAHTLEKNGGVPLSFPIRNSTSLTSFYSGRSVTLRVVFPMTYVALSRPWRSLSIDPWRTSQ